MKTTHSTILKAFKGLASLSVIALSACSTPIQKPQLAVDRDLQGFKEVSRWDNAEPVTIILTMQMFATSGRFQEGADHFHKLSEQHPDNPLYSSCEGVLMARMANDVPLISRIQWVNRALEKLDFAAKSKRTDTVLLKGLVEAELPFFFFRKDDAVTDLERALQARADLPFYGGRGIHAALARAYANLGNQEKSKEHLTKAGLDNLDDARILADGSYNPETGLRFTAPTTVQLEEHFWMFMGYDFTTVYAYDTPAGLIVIDAGTMPENGKALKRAIQAVSSHKIHTVIITHAHWDHIGGLQQLLDPETRILARSNFKSEIDSDNQALWVSPSFFGTHAKADPYSLSPSQVIAKRTTIEVGGFKLDLVPVASGETDDALVVFELKTRTAIVGDVLMPYFGAPWAAEGDPEHAVTSIQDLRKLNPAIIYAGHPPLTRYYGVDSLRGLEKALAESIPLIKAAITKGKGLADILNTLPLPQSLKDEPKAVLAYLVMREGLIQRVYRAHSGYWMPEHEGVAPRTLSEMASAVDLVAGGSASAFVHATNQLLERGDIDLAAKIAEYGRIKHPEDSSLKEAFDKAIYLNRQRNEMINPFKFLIYSNVGGKNLRPVDESSK